MAATSPKNTFVPILAKARTVLPPRSKVRVSMLKEEKVVKPPRKPTVNSRRRDSGSILVDFAKGSRKPSTRAIRKLPRVLTNNVPKGKAMPKRAPMADVVR